MIINRKALFLLVKKAFCYRLIPSSAMVFLAKTRLSLVRYIGKAMMQVKLQLLQNGLVKWWTGLTQMMDRDSVLAM